MPFCPFTAEHYFDDAMVQIQLMFDIDLSAAWFEDRHT